MFAFIRKHQFLAMIFILLVVASFVIFYTDRSHIGFGSNEGDYGSIQGKAVTGRQYYNAKKEAMLTHFFRFQDWPRSGSISEQMGWDTGKQTTERLFLISRLNELNININDQAVARQVAQLFRNGQPTVQEAYKAFLDKSLKPQGLTDEDFRRFLKHELGIQQLGSVVSVSGRLITPTAAEAAYRFDNQRVETKTVIFSSSNYLAKAKADVNPQKVTDFYAKRGNMYNLPARVQVAYVAFESINYLAEAGKLMAAETDLAKRVDEYYTKAGPNAFLDDKGQPLPADKAKEKIKDEQRKTIAQSLAQKKAYEFGNALLEMTPAAPGNIRTLADKNGFKVMETEPFGKLDGPKGITDNSKFASTAFGLSVTQPFAEPVEAGDNYYVLGFVNAIREQAQPLEAVRAKVEADYVADHALELARDAGEAFAREVTAGLTAGKKFGDIVKEKKFTVVDIAPFARSAQSITELEALRITPFQYRSAAFSHKAGEASQFTATGDGGFVLYVEKFLAADETKMKTDIKEYLETLRSRQASVAFNDWVNSELSAANVVPPASNKK